MASTLSLAELLEWSRLNNVAFDCCKIQDVPGKGLGLLADGAISGETNIITVPEGLVLSTEAVKFYAKQDDHFRELLDAVQPQTARKHILLFLLVQLANTRRIDMHPAAPPNSWTEYMRFLPSEVLLPTVWRELERELLQGTSLEAAVRAKHSSLESEVEQIREISCTLPHWKEALWKGKGIQLQDWCYLDACYRSRCLELPIFGESMVPCLDMANHSSHPNGYYETLSTGDIVLLLRPGASVKSGDEISISYGEAKSAAEMLFSYGFIDEESQTDSLVLPLEPLEGDPLAKAKSFVYPKPAMVKVSRVGGRAEWESPSAFLMCLNEEDGLDFGFTEDTDGSQQLRLFWQEVDITEQADALESLIRGHDLEPVFRLRVVTVVQERLSSALERIESVEPSKQASSAVRPECNQAASALRHIETRLLQDAIEALHLEKAHLLSDKKVQAYLGWTEVPKSDLADDHDSQ